MNLIEWIESVGVNRVADLADVSFDTVYQWKRCETSPKTMTAFRLINATHGLLTWESIYMPYVRGRVKDKKQLELFN